MPSWWLAKPSRLVWTIAILGMGITFPVVAAGLMVLAVASTVKTPRAAVAVAGAGVTFVLVILNSTKEVAGDWRWYIQLYGDLGSLQATELLGTRYGSGLISLKATEPVYYLLTAAVHAASGGSTLALSIVVTALVYGSASASLAVLATYTRISRTSAAMAVLPALLVGLTFSLVTQLVRQELALSFCLIACCLFLAGRPRLAAFASIIAVFTHNSSMIFLAAGIGAIVVVRTKRKVRLFVSFAATMFLCGLVYRYRYASASYLEQDNGSISIAVLVLDLLLIGFAFVTSARSGGPIRDSSVMIAATYAGMVAFLIPIMGLPVPFLRMYLYVEGLRLMAVFLLSARLVSSRRLPAVPYAAAGAVAYFVARLATSPWSYDYSILYSPFL